MLDIKKILENKNVVILTRASDKKLVTEGATLEHQLERCFAFLDRYGIPRSKVKGPFTIIESGDDEQFTREQFQEVKKYCLDKSNNIGLLLFLKIGRLTRGGEKYFLELKNTLIPNGVFMQDTYETFGPEVNTLEHLGVKFKWSGYFPSEASELAEARRAKEEKREILTRMIGAELEYIISGYAGRGAPFGLKNKEIVCKDGKRKIHEANPPESEWVIKMFELSEAGTFEDEQIVEMLNTQGYESRTFDKWDKSKKNIIGRGGGIPLTVKQLRKYLANTIYCGYIVEEWGKNTPNPKVLGPIKCVGFDGLVSVETYNKANRGKRVLTKTKDGYILEFNKKPVKRLRNNPEFPYKKFVLCPICKNEMIGSASTNKTGKRYPAYHCTRGHSRFAVPKKDFENTLKEFVDRIEFTDKRKDEIRESIVEVWREKEIDAGNQAKIIEEKIIEVRTRKQDVYQNILRTQSGALREQLESDFEQLSNELEGLMRDRNSNENEELEINKFLKYVTLVMEHPYRIVADAVNPLDKGLAFSAFFNTKPTYDNIVNGTPDLKPIYQLSKANVVQKESLVTPRRVELRFPG